jgi:hypothetical protein
MIWIISISILVVIGIAFLCFSALRLLKSIQSSRLRVCDGDKEEEYFLWMQFKITAEDCRTKTPEELLVLIVQNAK